MAQLPEAASWETGIYQLKTDDPVMGGVDGIDNLQAKQLANRTTYLKTEVEKRAPLASPALTGTPTAPTPAVGTNTAQLATAAFVQQAIAALVASSPAALDTLKELATALGNDANFATTMTNALALKAPLASPVFTGNPVAPTPAAGDNDTSLATTAFVQQAVNGRLVKSVAGGATVTLTPAEAGYAIIELTGALTANIAVIVPNSTCQWIIKNTTTGAFTLTLKTAAGTGVIITQGTAWQVFCDGTNVVDAISDLKDVALTGVSTAPTPALGTNTEQIANTAFVQAAVAALVASSPAALDTLKELATALGNDANFATTMTNALALKAPLASPAFTGNPVAPTPAPGVSQQVANMDAVTRAMGSYRGYRNLTANTVLTAADVGFYIGISGTGLTVTLPAGAGLTVGSTFTFGANGAFTIAAAVGNTISSPTGTAQASAVMSGFCSIVWRGDFWQIVMGGDRAGTNFLMLPGGNIVQWGQGVAKGNDGNNADPNIGGLQTSFPMAFPTGPLSVVCTHIGADASYAIISRRWTATSFFAETAGLLDAQFSWIAIGR